MKKHNVFMALIASTSLALVASATGCAVAPSAPEAEEAVGASGETILVDEEGGATLEGIELRIERRAGESDFALVGASDWQAVAPGVWDIPTGDGGAQRVAVGEEGHRWLLEQAEAEVDALQARLEAGADRAELEAELSLAEEKLLSAQRGVESSIAAPVPQAVSCNFSLYTGPSSAVTSPAIFGAAALAQVACSGGCVTFTVMSQACCSGWCSNTSVFTRSVCSTPWTAGTLRSGSGAGYAWVNLNPPNISQSSSSFFCQ